MQSLSQMAITKYHVCLPFLASSHDARRILIELNIQRAIVAPNHMQGR